MLLIVFRERFVEWVAGRNYKYGIVNRHDRAARFTALIIGLTLICLGLLLLVVRFAKA
jgi:hypothetical protein